MSFYGANVGNFEGFEFLEVASDESIGKPWNWVWCGKNCRLESEAKSRTLSAVGDGAGPVRPPGPGVDYLIKNFRHRRQVKRSNSGRRVPAENVHAGPTPPRRILLSRTT